jgi:hypothetical protein
MKNPELILPNQKSQPHPRRLWGCTAIVVAGLTFVCLTAAGASVLSNQLLPSQTPETGRLTDLDKARLAEAIQLRSQKGEALWAGWGQADIPMIVYTGDYAFLVGYPDPPDGWIKIPNMESRGGPWEQVQGDSFEGEPYYRQKLPSQSISPEAFAVQVGNRWVSSLGSKEWMEISLGNEFAGSVPESIRPLFPYRLAGRLFLSAAGGTDWYICGLLHESFHAYEGILDSARLSNAETVFHQNQSRYPWDGSAFTDAWQTELNILADAALAESKEETIDLANQFLSIRHNRRATAGLDDGMIQMEQLKEWEEGLAKFTELAIWRLAATDNSYKPMVEIEADPGFYNYANIDQRWRQEIDQIRRMASAEGDTRFYYSGWAQAIILDRLLPNWKAMALTEGFFLDDLVRIALNP